MQRWWESKQFAWGQTLIFFAVGTAMAFVSPEVGLPICGALVFSGILLLVRAYKGRGRILNAQHNKDGASDGESLAPQICDVLQKLQIRYAYHAQKAVNQYISLFDFQQFSKFCAHLDNSQSKDVLGAINQRHEGETLEADEFRMRDQIDGLSKEATAMLPQDLSLERLESFARLVNSIPQMHDKQFRGFIERRKEDKKWGKINGKLNRVMVEQPELSRDETLTQLIDEYIKLTLVYAGVVFVGELIRRYAPTEWIPTEYIESGGLDLGPVMDGKMNKKLGQIGARIQEIERGNILSIFVTPYSGRRNDWEKGHLMWAELKVTNTSPNHINDVQMNITECLMLQQKSGSSKQNELTMQDFLKLNSFSVYWSENQAPPKQMLLDIPKNATRASLVAFQDDPNGNSFYFNSPNNDWVVGGAKISVEISNREAVLWTGAFYIQCHPNYTTGERAKFEFSKWDVWEKDKDITLSGFHK